MTRSGFITYLARWLYIRVLDKRQTFLFYGHIVLQGDESFVSTQTSARFSNVADTDEVFSHPMPVVWHDCLDEEQSSPCPVSVIVFATDHCPPPCHTPIAPPSFSDDHDPASECELSWPTVRSIWPHALMPILSERPAVSHGWCRSKSSLKNRVRRFSSSNGGLGEATVSSEVKNQTADRLMEKFISPPHSKSFINRNNTMARLNPVMIRLTETEKKILAKEAKKEKTSMSDLIRRRALSGVTLESIDARLKTIETSMRKAGKSVGWSRKTRRAWRGGIGNDNNFQKMGKSSVNTS